MADVASVLRVAVNILLRTVINVLLYLPLLRASGRVLGWSLRRKTNSRRQLILRRVAAEEAAYIAKARKGNPEDDDWERVETYASGPAETKAQSTQQWEGVIGFFHPFWYAFLIFKKTLLK